MPQLTIRTRQTCWVVPEHFEVVKLMIAQNQLRASELCFASDKECQCFAKKLSLMALADECKNRAPSIIAELSRHLVAQSSSQNDSTNLKPDAKK